MNRKARGHTRARRVLSWVVVGIGFAGASAIAQSAVARFSVMAAEGRRTEAVFGLEEHLRAQPDDGGARLLLGSLLVDEGRDADAREAFETVLAANPSSPEALNNLAVLAAADDEPERAIENLKAALATHPSYSTVFENLRRVYGSLAGEAYRQALDPEIRARVPDAERPRLELELVRGLPPGAAPTEDVSPPIRTPVDEPIADPAPVTPRPEPVVAEQPRETEENRRQARQEAISRTVVDWAAAWSSQDVDRYLSFYARRFVPTDGSSREAWAANQRSALGSPSFIRVGVSDLGVREVGGRFEVRFRQRYEADGFSDSVTRYLGFIREDGEWKIDRERSTP